mgnify:CR=1 FL=1
MNGIPSLDFLTLTGQKSVSPYVGGSNASGASAVHGPQQQQQEGGYKPNFASCNCELRPEMADDQRAQFLDFDA